MPDDLMTIRGMRDRLGGEPTLAEVLDQIKRDHPDEHGDVLVERLKIAIAIFRLRRKTLGLDDEAPSRIRITQETHISEGHIIASAALIGVLMIIAVALFTPTSGRVVASIARDAGYSIGRFVIDHAFGASRHRRRITRMDTPPAWRLYSSPKTDLTYCSDWRARTGSNRQPSVSKTDTLSS